MKSHRDASESEKFSEMNPKVRKFHLSNPSENILKGQNSTDLIARGEEYLSANSLACYLIRRVLRHLYLKKG
jgi:hypothetical protein